MRRSFKLRYLYYLFVFEIKDYFYNFYVTTVSLHILCKYLQNLLIYLQNYHIQIYEWVTSGP
ncbi:hypothetical protein IEQ34_021513 [Dendrobium chrysotoxum]|uniref:Uncharacterized protein n=1 Tax=Dendrobium chrysotoxum TaxID=161865 RepID=A0AAV7G399_DENCH|nr:hypothetical protein IEQ34_021513 [Dendrobium chrysotoxum]